MDWIPFDIWSANVNFLTNPNSIYLFIRIKKKKKAREKKKGKEVEKDHVIN